MNRELDFFLRFSVVFKLNRPLLISSGNKFCRGIYFIYNASGIRTRHRTGNRIFWRRLSRIRDNNSIADLETFDRR